MRDEEEIQPQISDELFSEVSLGCSLKKRSLHCVHPLRQRLWHGEEPVGWPVSDLMSWTMTAAGERGSVASFRGNWSAPAARWRSTGSVLVCARSIQWWTYVAVLEKPWQRVDLMEGKPFFPFLTRHFHFCCVELCSSVIWPVFGNIGDNFYCLKHDFLLCFSSQWICRLAQIYFLFCCCLRFCFGGLLLAGRKKTYQPMNF